MQWNLLYMAIPSTGNARRKWHIHVWYVADLHRFRTKEIYHRERLYKRYMWLYTAGTTGVILDKTLFYFLNSVWTERNKKLGVYILFGMCYSTSKLNMVLHWCICKDIFPDIGMIVHSTFPGYLKEKNIKYMTWIGKDVLLCPLLQVNCGTLSFAYTW